MNIFFLFFRRIQQLQFRYTRMEVVQIVGAILMLALMGTTAYSLIEGWSPVDALYATIITITTVGYGDLTPTTRAGRIFAIFFTLFAITLGGYSISTLAAYIIEGRDRKISAKYRKRRMNRINALKQHYILCGADLVGTRIAEEFTQEKVDYVVIDGDESLLKTTLLYSHPEYFQQKLKTLVDFDEIDLSHFEDLTLEEVSERMGIPYILADPTDDSALIRAGIDHAVGLIAACPDDRDNLSIVIGARNLANRAGNDKLRIMTRVNDPKNIRKLYLAGADFVRIPTIMSGMEMATHMLHPEIGNWWYSRVGENKNSGMFQQVNLTDQPGWVGQTVADIHRLHGVVILTVKRDEEFISPPTYDFLLRADDIAITLRNV